MKINTKRQEGIVTAELVGRLDTPASQEVGNDLLVLQNDADKTIILDCTALEYISSSGLRLFSLSGKPPARKAAKSL